jgi:hypothetical protein
MGTTEKLYNRFLKFPKDFSFLELKTLLKRFGYDESNKGRTSGSRVRFYNEEKKRPIDIHKPHDGIMKSYAMKQVYEELRDVDNVDIIY